MRLRQINDMDKISNGRPVRGGVVGSKDTDGVALALEHLRHNGHEVRSVRWVLPVKMVRVGSEMKSKREIN